MSSEKEIITFGQIKDGKIHYTKINEFKGAVFNKFKENERFMVIYRKIYQKRSSAQNRYYWGIIINCYLQGHEDVNGRPLGLEFINQKSGEILYIPLSEKEQAEKAHEALKSFFNTDPDGKVRSTTDNTTTQQEEYHQYCRDYIKFAFNFDVPLPGEQGELFKND